MNFTFEKLDPSCYNVLPIRFDEEPAQSLSTINVNFSALDAEVCNLGFSAENVWNPLYTNFNDNSSSWDSVYETVQSFSACWQSTYTTVRDLSASWLSPITIIYPTPISSGDFDRNVIEAWVIANFPVEQGGCINYLNGQIMKVFTLEYALSNQQVTARCSGVGGKVTRKFIGIGSFTVNCGCTCKPTLVNCPDRYTSNVQGIELIVVNGEWEYLRDIY